MLNNFENCKTLLFFSCDSNHYQISYILALAKQHQNKKALNNEENEIDMNRSEDELSLLSMEDAIDF